LCNCAHILEFTFHSISAVTSQADDACHSATAAAKSGCGKVHRPSCEERVPGGLSITGAVAKITDIAVRNGLLEGSQLLELWQRTQT